MSHSGWKSLLVLSLCALAANAAAEPAHYAVFGLGDDGDIAALYYARVDLATDASAPDADKPAIVDDRAGIRWRGIGPGSNGAVHRIEIPDTLHAEFARDVRTGVGSIEAFEVPNPQRSFVVRLPLTQGNAIEIATTSGTTRQIDLAELAARADRLPLAGRVPVARPMRAAAAGDPANRVDILVFGDGYTAGQQALFDANIAALRSDFFQITPYMDYQSFINWTPVFVPSQDAGATHPPYQAGCTTDACCSDAAAQSDPLAGQVTTTAFEARFCAYQIHRLLVADYALVQAAAAAYPDWDIILVSINDPVYGGSGGQIGVISAHALAHEITIHEYGHTFTGLADEYDSAYPGYPSCSDLGGSSPCEANVTNQTSPDAVKWRNWFTPGNPIPTPAGTPGVGLFQGARYLQSGMYRPVDHCEMQVLGVEFCPVCRQEYVSQLYHGGWGAPAGGIDLIEPGSESPPASQAVAYALGSSLDFAVELLQPSIGEVGIEWLLDGQPIAGASDPTYAFSQEMPEPAIRTLQLRVSDRTALVDPDMADGLLESSRNWTIHIVAGDTIFDNGFDP